MIELIRTFPSYFVCQNSTSTLASDKEKCDKIIHIFPDICAQSRPNLNQKIVHKLKMYLCKNSKSMKIILMKINSFMQKKNLHCFETVELKKTCI